jgi:hypothetical protein
MIRFALSPAADARRNTSLRCRPLALLVSAIIAAAASSSAYAYRPFDGTDAAVAEPGVFELEIGASRVRQGDSRTLALPATTFNFGIAGDTEIVIDARVNRQLGTYEGYRTSLDDTALSVKHVWRKGVLQDEAGISIASECGVLLPTLHGESGTGASCAGIASERIGEAAVHLNAALARTRDKTNSRFLGAIVEGPESWAVRPVMELSLERESNGSRTNSALLGAIWKQSEDLSLDLGVRQAHVDGERLTELRVGATWSYSAH